MRERIEKWLTVPVEYKDLTRHRRLLNILLLGSVAIVTAAERA